MRAVPALLLLFVLSSLPASAAGSKIPTDAAVNVKVATDYGKLPISFEANQGQAAQPVKFVAHGQGYGLYLDGQEAVLALHSAKPDNPASIDTRDKTHRLATYETSVVRMQLRGANPGSEATGVDLLPGKANYFIGKDPAQWHSGTPTYSKVKFSGVYPGIDLVYYGNQSQLEYDFVVAPGASTRLIRMRFEGASRVALNANGDLAVSASHGQIAFHKPVVYQQIEGHRRAVDGRFALRAGNSVGFTIGDYDHSQALIIDPVLTYSTYLGGNDNVGEISVAADRSGSAYIAGTTQATDFPTTPGVYESSAPPAEPYSFFIFVSKLNASGTALEYSTYLGDSDNFPIGDHAKAIAIDSDGDAYVTGYTSSTAFPVTPGAYQNRNKDLCGSNTAFVTELNPSGSSLVYSTYLGGTGFCREEYPPSASGGDAGYGIAVDTEGNTYVTGSTISPDFPVTSNAFQRKLKGSTDYPVYAGFITKLNPGGTKLVYSTLLSGSGGDSTSAIAVDSSGNAYVTGTAYSSDFPITPGVVQPAMPSANGSLQGPLTNAFATKLNATGSALIYSTYIGGEGSGGTDSPGEIGNDIAIDAAGDAYITGESNSDNFPTTAGAFESVNKFINTESLGRGFVTKLNPTATAFLYSTLLGGSQYDWASAIAVDNMEEAYVVGFTESPDFPVTPDALDSTYHSSYETGFVTELNSIGSGVIYSTFLGGSHWDYASAIATDKAGNFYVAGITSSTDFPVTPGAFQTDPKSQQGFTLADPFVTKLNFSSQKTIPTTTKISPSAFSPNDNQTLTFTVTVTNRKDGSPVTSGVVHMGIDGKAVMDVPLDETGAAQYIITEPFSAGGGAGHHVFQATFAGDQEFSSSYEIQSYTILPQTPTFNTASGEYVGSVTVSIKNNDSGNPAVHYTTDGNPVTASSPLYAAPFTLTAPEVRFAVVRAAVVGYLDPTVVSATALASYSIVPQTPEPKISPAPGAYAAGQLITISDATPTATIRYTTDGSTPTATSRFYAGPFPLTGTETVQAIAITTQDATSAVASSAYTVK